MNTEQRTAALTDLGLTSNGTSFELKDIFVECETVYGIDDDGFTALIANIKEYMLANPQDYPLSTTGKETKELTIIDRAAQTLSTGSAILTANQAKADKFVKASKGLIGLITANGGKLNPELDAKANTAIIALKQAGDEIEADTKELRQAMVMIRDTLLDSKKRVNAEEQTIQNYRNSYAIECENEKKRLAEIERIAAEKRQAIIDTKADIEKALLRYFSDYLLQKKQSVNTWFNAITLADYEAKAKSLEETAPIYDSTHYQLFKYNYSGRILTSEEVATLREEVCGRGKYEELSAYYQNEIIELKSTLIDLLPSKKNELERIAAFEKEQEEERKRLAAIEEEKKTADAARQVELKRLQKEAEDRQAEAKRLELEEKQVQADREEADRQRQEEENREKLAAQEQAVTVEAAQATTISLFEQTANTSPIASGPKAKTVLKAQITSIVGIYPIVQLYIEGLGKDMTIDQIMDKFEFAMNYASKMANAKVPLKIENPLVVYLEDTKAVTERKKKEKEVDHVA